MMSRLILGITAVAFSFFVETAYSSQQGEQLLSQAAKSQDAHLLTSMFLLERNVPAPANNENAKKLMMESLLDPSFMPSHRRGEFVDTLYYKPYTSDQKLSSASLSSSGSATKGTTTQLRKKNLSPEPRVEQVPLQLETIDGDGVTMGAAGGSNWIVSVYYDHPTYSALWKTALLEQLFSGLPDSTQVLFGIGPGVAGADDVMEAMRTRCKATNGYSKVQSRVHFLKKQFAPCNVNDFPNCPDNGDGHGWLGQAVTGWGSMSPKLAATWQGGSLALASAGDTGWLKPMTTFARDNQV
jgi:hypothetical protein